MNIDSASFNICGFLFTDTVREITISIKGECITICEEKFGDTNVWIVPSAALEGVLQNRFRSFYPMFLGVLLETLHENKALVPINGICFDDLDQAFMNGNLQGLASGIATGTYQSGVIPIHSGRIQS